MRRHIAGLLFLGAILFVGSRFLVARESIIKCEIHYLLGQNSIVSGVETVIRAKDVSEELARFATELVAPVIVQNTRLPKAKYEVEIILKAPRRPSKSLIRTIDVVGDGIVVVDLSKEAW